MGRHLQRISVDEWNSLAPHSYLNPQNIEQRKWTLHLQISSGPHCCLQSVISEGYSSIRQSGKYHGRP